MTDQPFPVASGFAAFLPAEYREGFSPDWLGGLSPFEDRTCARCFSVRQGEWVAFGPPKVDERLLTCERSE
ncbi:MAG: hypothetical protein MRJ67_07110 [Nitrospirales bacterium]|nr:hypothetical protein [Nitrospirales bacterium]